MPNALPANTQTVLAAVAGAWGLLTLGAVVLAQRTRRRTELTGEESLRRELAAVGRRLAALETSMTQIAEALPRSIQGVGVLRYTPFAEVGGNMSFSLALLDGHASGVVISVLNDRNGSRVYGKAIERGTSASPLSEEEQQAVALARGDR
jgi:hypothetical protein